MATFAIQVAAGHARGHVRGSYQDLKIAVLDGETGTEKGFDNRFASFLANTFKVGNSNGMENSDTIRVGQVDYVRTPEDGFMKFIWVGLRTGVLDLISH